MLTLTSFYHRSQQLNSGAFSHVHDLVYHLVHCLLRNHMAALGAVRNTYSGIQKSEIIIDLRDGTDCRSGVAVGRLLVNGNSGRQSVYAFHIRFLHLSQELSGIGRQRFHVSALPFRIDSIKGQGGFSRSGHTGQDYQFISGDVHINSF